MRIALELAVVFRRSYRRQTVGRNTITRRLVTVATTVFIVCITLLAQPVQTMVRSLVQSVFPVQRLKTTSSLLKRESMRYPRRHRKSDTVGKPCVVFSEQIAWAMWRKSYQPPHTSDM